MVTLAITTYNRVDMTIRSFQGVLDDDRVSEIVIVDDCSKPKFYDALEAKLEKYEKVKLYRNEHNLGCYHNKRRAVELSSNDWVILFDSDNTIDSSYIDAFISGDYTHQPHRIYAPEFARPHFDYRHFAGAQITYNNVKNYSRLARFDCLINTCNFTVNREEYLKIFDQGMAEPWTADTLYFNHCWLKAGNEIHVIRGMQYDHLVHDGSHYQEHVRKTGDLATRLLNDLT